MNPPEKAQPSPAAARPPASGPAKPLRALLVEDSENDALLLELELQRSGYETECLRVDSREAMEVALEQPWEVVIADYLMPRFNGLEALALVKGRGLDLPFIIVSGHITDDTAVAAMKAGAHDYVMKDNLTRLGPAVQRELREAEERRQRRSGEARLKVERVFREAIENSVPSGIAAVDLEGRQTYVNPAFCELVGWTERELVGARPPFVYWPPDQVDTIVDALGRVIQDSTPATGIELPFRRRTGERLLVLLQVTPLKDIYGNITGWVSSISDITERKRAEVRLAAEHAITRLLTHATSMDATAPAILNLLLDSLEMDVGLLWTPDPGQRWLHPVAVQLRAPTPPLQAFAEAMRGLTLPPGSGLPGRVWQSREAICQPDLAAVENTEPCESAVNSGLQSAMAFPIQSAGNFFGVLQLFAVPRLDCDPALVNMMSAIGSEIGQFLERRAAEDALRRAHDELEIRVQQRTAELKSANARLQAAIAERKRLENELLEITEKERRRIGLDLHDDLGQKLSGIAMMTKGLELKLARTHKEAAGDAAKIHGLVQAAMSHTSDVAHDLATLDLANKELPTALEDLAAQARDAFGIACRFSRHGVLPSLDPHVVTQVYKIAQEAVTNAIKHGKAKKVAITLADGSDQLVLTVQNNGLPFPDLRSQSTGMGLRIMNYRASLVGATLEIKGLGSKGTLVTCTMPIGTQEIKKH